MCSTWCVRQPAPPLYHEASLDDSDGDEGERECQRRLAHRLEALPVRQSYVLAGVKAASFPGVQGEVKLARYVLDDCSRVRGV